MIHIQAMYVRLSGSTLKKKDFNFIHKNGGWGTLQVQVLAFLKSLQKP